jgi:acetyl-CoA synthetase
MPKPDKLESYHIHEQEWNSYDTLREEFEWEIPDEFNIAEYVCDRWASDKSRVMMFADGDDQSPRTYTFWQARNITNQLANKLAQAGVKQGDRVGVNLAQQPETVLSHLAIWKLGAVSVPLSTLFGPEALEHRLNDSDAKVCIVDESNLNNLRAVADGPDALGQRFVVGGAAVEDGEKLFWDAIEGASKTHDAATTAPDDPAVIYYTSGSTGSPKGCLHTQSHLLGHLPQFQVVIADMQVKPSDLYWTPSEWAWAGSLLLHILPALFYGRPVLAYGGEFYPEKTFRILEKYGVSHTFLTPTAIRMMQQAEDTADRHDLREVDVIWSGGEEVGESVIEWATETFKNATIHTSYGLSEAAGVLCNATVTEFRVATSGRAAPGHDVEIIDPETAEPLGPNEKGEIGIRYEDDPGVFEEYWNRPNKTEERKYNGFLRTGDLAVVDEDGYFSFIGRKDDVIISSGYRIGPEEIEDSIANHEAVLDAGVIGVPHPERGEVPKAFVVLADKYSPSDSLKEELQTFVKENLAKYEYPRELEFIEELPMTVTGKIQRYKLREHENIE